jgi:hypothetical protein
MALKNIEVSGICTACHLMIGFLTAEKQKKPVDLVYMIGL